MIKVIRLTTPSSFAIHPISKPPRPSGTPPLKRRGINSFLLSPFSLLLFCFLPSALFAQKLFSISQNHLSQENVSYLRNQVAQSDVSELSLTRNNEDKNVYAVSFSSVKNTEIILLNEETGAHVVITPTEKSQGEFQLSPFLIEELKQAMLGEANHYLLVETSSDFTVKKVTSVSVSDDAVYIPRYFYGKKENRIEALPKDRQIVSILKQKPQIISAFPDDMEHQRYIAQLEEEMSYYVYMYKLPDGTLCTYDEHFNPKPQQNRSSVGNFFEFILTGELTEKQHLATEYALELWSEQLAGTIPVNIEVNVVPLGEGIIGMSFFPPVRGTDTLYPTALWKQLTGINDNDEWDIFIVMSSKFNFYYGLDGNTSGIDYVTIMIHEVTHGLGFSCFCSPDGEFFYEVPGIYDFQLYKGLDGPPFTELNESERAALMVSNNLYSGSPDSHLLKANNGVRVKMYAPYHYSGGSTAHHWDNNMDFQNFMQYSYQYPLHTFNNRKTGIFMDMGYKAPEIDSNAVWITYNGNGGTGTRNPQPFLPDVAQKLKINSFSKIGCAFAGWNTSPDGDGISYQDREEISINENLELYAQWVPGTFTLTFYASYGTVSPKSKQVTVDSPIGELPIPVRYGYKFVGWYLFNRMITEETIWIYPENFTTIAKWTVADAIEEIQNEDVVQIFPNPTTGQLRIESNKGINPLVSVEVFDVMGKKVSSNHLIPTSSNHLIDISNLSNGIYFLKITTENGMVTKKIIKI